MRKFTASEANKRGLFSPEGGYSHSFKVGDKTFDMPIGVVSNRPMSTWDIQQPVIYVPTYGERAESSALTALSSEAPVVVFTSHGSDIPREIADTKHHALERAMRETFPTFVQFVLENSHANSVGVSGGSAGATKIGYGLRESGGEGIGSIGLWNPLGLTNWTEDGIQKTTSGFVSCGRRVNPLQRRYLLQTAEQIHEVNDDIRSGMFMKQMAIANTANFAPEYIAHASLGNKVLILSGTRDLLFPTSEIIDSLCHTSGEKPFVAELIDGCPSVMSFIDGRLLVREVMHLPHITSVLSMGQATTQAAIEFAREKTIR
jgi:hypothetical protein